MSQPTTPGVRPEPMIAVADVPAASAWYQRILGAASGHGGAEYDVLLVDGTRVLQLHQSHEGHHHGTIGDPDGAAGNGVALWFVVDDFDAALGRIRAAAPTIVTDAHVNPNAQQREIWLRDPDGYLVVLAGPSDYHPDR